MSLLDPKSQEEILKKLDAITARLPNDMGEFPIDRHLREIRDEIRMGLAGIKQLLWERRNGSGRDGVIPGLNRVEDRVDGVYRLGWALLIAWVLGFGGIFWAITKDWISRVPQ